MLSMRVGENPFTVVGGPMGRGVGLSRASSPAAGCGRHWRHVGGGGW